MLSRLFNLWVITTIKVLTNDNEYVKNRLKKCVSFKTILSKEPS